MSTWGGIYYNRRSIQQSERQAKYMAKSLVVVRGAGDLASGVIAKLYNSGYQVLALECEKPLSIRRKVSFSEAVYQGAVTIGGVTACLCTLDMVDEVLESGRVPVLVDPDCEIVKVCRPRILVDAILAKRNLGTRMNMADITIGLGPGFTAGVDVHAVVETKRGHDLGRIYYEGTAIPNTGIPGKIGGYDKERVLYSPADGVLVSSVKIGEVVLKGQEIARIGEVPVTATIDGVLRGILPDGLKIRSGWKMADIDPRMEEQKNCFTISDKARCIAGGVLEAILHLELSRRHQAYSLLEALQIIPEKHRVIAVVGGGGKTTLIYELARELRECGLRALVTTTTHMYKEGKYGFTPLGTVCGDGKIRGVDPDVPQKYLEEYDVVLVEADGSRGLPVKCPASYEPVLPAGVDLVIGVAGATAIGGTVLECCHRYLLACDLLGCTPQDPVTAEHLLKILTSQEGQKKGVTDCEYRYLINQAERLSQTEREELLQLQKEYGEIGSVVSFWEEKWYNAPVTD